MAPLEADLIKESLHSSFTKLAQSLDGDEITIQKWTDLLIARYTEPQRRYHTVYHIHSMLTSLEQVHAQVHDETTVQLAIFFHDWIYDPQAKDNETRSIEHFEKFANDINLSPSTTITVAGYIKCTIQHSLDPKLPNTDLALFLDFDLEVLSRSECGYAEYAAQIREEYGHFSNEAYCTGRIKVLQAFLDRERVYFSDAFREREHSARENMEREIKRLQDALQK